MLPQWAPQRHVGSADATLEAVVLLVCLQLSLSQAALPLRHGEFPPVVSQKLLVSRCFAMDHVTYCTHVMMSFPRTWKMIV